MPDRAGVKTSWLTMGSLIFKALPSLPRFIANRPSVVDARVQEVWAPSQSAIFPSPMNPDFYSSSKRLRPRRVMKGLAPLGECYGIRDSKAPANVLARYCFGCSMAARLGSTESLNTIVVAHPSNLTPDQMRAIKVNPSRSVVRLKI